MTSKLLLSVSWKDASFDINEETAFSVACQFEWTSSQCTAASFGVTEDNYDFHLYSTTQLPTTWSYSSHSHDSDTGISVTGSVVDGIIHSAEFSVSFHY